MCWWFVDRDGFVSLQEYMAFMISRETENVQSAREVIDAFRALTTGEKQYITATELFAVSHLLSALIIHRWHCPLFTLGLQFNFMCHMFHNNWLMHTVLNDSSINHTKYKAYTVYRVTMRWPSNAVSLSVRNRSHISAVVFIASLPRIRIIITNKNITSAYICGVVLIIANATDS